MRVSVLCSGSKGNACLIEHENTRLLIDCGSTKTYLLSALEKVHVKPSDITALLVTHAHKDHVSQLKLFAHVDTYSWCDLKNCPKHHSIAPEEPFTIQDLHIEAIALSHDSQHTVGYVIGWQDQKLVYVTDTGYFKHAYIPKLSNARAYIFESNYDLEMLRQTRRPLFLQQRINSDIGHLSNTDCGRALASLIGEQTTHVVLAHISQEANDPQLALDCVEEILRARQIELEGLQLQAASQYEMLQLELADGKQSE